MSKYSEGGSFQVWNNKTPLYSRSLERYFENLSEIYEYFDDPWERDEQVKEDFDSIRDSNVQLCNYLELYICTPVYFPELEIPEFLYSELPEQMDDIYDAIPQDHPIIQKINKLNQFIFKQNYVLWYEESKIKPIPDSLESGYKEEVKAQRRRRREPFDD